MENKDDSTSDRISTTGKSWFPWWREATPMTRNITVLAAASVIIIAYLCIYKPWKNEPETTQQTAKSKGDNSPAININGGNAVNGSVQINGNVDRQLNFLGNSNVNVDASTKISTTNAGNFIAGKAFEIWINDVKTEPNRIITVGTNRSITIMVRAIDPEKTVINARLWFSPTWIQSDPRMHESDIETSVNGWVHGMGWTDNGVMLDLWEWPKVNISPMDKMYALPVIISTNFNRFAFVISVSADNALQQRITNDFQIEK